MQNAGITKEETMKDLLVEKLDVWSAVIDDKPGGLAKILTGLKGAGADLDFVLARRSPDKPGSGVVFVSPLRGDKETSSASYLGFNVVSSLDSLRVEGPNMPGIAAGIAEKLASAGINLHGLSAAIIGPKFVMYISFDNEEDTTKAAALLMEEQG
jgi:hypothetical protein